MAQTELEVETVAVIHELEELEPAHEPYLEIVGFDQKLPGTRKS